MRLLSLPNPPSTSQILFPRAYDTKQHDFPLLKAWQTLSAFSVIQFYLNSIGPSGTSRNVQLGALVRSQLVPFIPNDRADDSRYRVCS